jgi:UDP-N-acetylmuramyl tripeptide synthase
VAILTSDNPRREPPERIAAMVRSGAEGRAAFVEAPDRRRAIQAALETASQEDVVVVAGKGHETTQTIGTVEHEFSDVDVVRALVGEAAR